MKRELSAILVFLLVFSASLTLTQAGFPPRIEKVTLVHYLAQSSGPPAWDENEDDYRLIAGGVRWWDVPVVYVVNLKGSGLEEANSLGDLDKDGKDEPDALEILQLASEEWDDGDYSGWGGVTVDLFEEDPETTDKSTVGMDGVNLILWSDLDEGVIAVTHLWFIPSMKKIVEFDIEFNTDYDWSLTGEYGKMDLQNIATHEFGHAVGLDDLRPPMDWALTMYAYSDFGETMKRSLGLGDQLGVEDLYED